MKICTYTACGKKHKGRGYCQGHLRQITTGRELKPLNAYNAGGGFKISGDGYIQLFKPEYQKQLGRKSKYIFEHRYVMEQYLGRPLLAHENVHHKNGVRTDNDIKNLELWIKPQPAGQRLDDLLDWLLDNYPEEVKRKLVQT